MGVMIGSLALLTIKEPSRGAIDPERFESGEESSEANTINAESEELPDQAIKKTGNPIKDLLSNDVARLCTFATSFRYINYLTMDYFFPAYMLLAFPTLRTKFLSFDALLTFCCGLFSALAGGFLASKYGEKNPRNYARICLFGTMIAWPATVIGVTT